MSTIRIETVPQTWTDTDTAFFAITARLFSAQFTYGASVLLASCDTGTAADDALPADAAAATAPASSSVASRDLAPAMLRRNR